jgi:hypothetical protein
VQRANNSNFIGNRWLYATSASNSNFIGYLVIYHATSAYNSNFFGYQAGIAQQMYSGQIYLNQYWGWGEEFIIQISW